MFWRHVILLVLGFPFFAMIFNINTNSNEDGLEVLSYNVRVFNNYAHLNKHHEISKEMIQWVVEEKAPVKCFQEFYNKDTSKIFNVKERLKNAGWKHFHQINRFEDKEKGQFGQAIFSKYPIVNKGKIENNGEFLNSIWADIIYNGDTLRVYCTHLESMSIDEDNIVNTEKFKNSYIDTGYRLKNGFITRARQVDHLLAHIEKCTIPVVVCGDFNELPFSYPYVLMKRNLNNAFELAGNGFGFSYNGKLFFLRIDNQFFSDRLRINKFSTLKNVKFSDHYPLSAYYEIIE